MCFCQFLGPLLGRKGNLGFEEAPGASSLHKSCDNCFGFLLSSLHWLLVRDELCSKCPEMLLKHLTVCSDELAVIAAATMELASGVWGLPWWTKKRKYLSLAVAHPFGEYIQHGSVKLGSPLLLVVVFLLCAKHSPL